MDSSIRVRFAPSPTGYLHVGGARSALYNYVFAKKMGGQFILRIEDTDEARSTEESLRIILNDLTWLGMTWDEGPDPITLMDKGSFGPYYQSRRLEIYAKYAQQLIQSGKAYYCFLTEAESEAQREALVKAGGSLQMQSPYADWTEAQALARMQQSHEKPTVRFKTKALKRDYVFTDLIRGEVRFPSDMVGDFVILRSGGMPVYNFCCVIDDGLMQISHVLRAEEHLPNTLRQLMLYEALGWRAPQFGHMSLILNEDRQKLSKRHGAVACSDFRAQGYLPEALANFMALLGWSSPDGKEILSLEEMIAGFRLDHLHSSGAVFDVKKLRWMNAQYLRALPDEKLWNLVEPFLHEAGIETPTDREWKLRSVQTFKSSMETLKDAVELYRPISDKHFTVLAEAKETLLWEPTKKIIQAWLRAVQEHAKNSFTEAEFLALQTEIQRQTGVQGKFLFMPIRVAVIGKPQGSELKNLVPLLNKKSLVDRAMTVLAMLG